MFKGKRKKVDRDSATRNELVTRLPYLIPGKILSTKPKKKKKR